MVSQLSRIMEMIDTLKEVDTEHAEPLTSVLNSSQRVREDQVTVQNIQSKLFANIPGKDAEFAREVSCFIVPKVVE
jgi:aspartyl/glutamyl-tRNA(Asn/Gln) amidotransferase C subunit